MALAPALVFVMAACVPSPLPSAERDPDRASFARGLDAAERDLFARIDVDRGECAPWTWAPNRAAELASALERAAVALDRIEALAVGAAQIESLGAALPPRLASARARTNALCARAIADARLGDARACARRLGLAFDLARLDGGDDVCSREIACMGAQIAASAIAQIAAEGNVPAAVLGEVLARARARSASRRSQQRSRRAADPSSARESWFAVAGAALQVRAHRQAARAWPAAIDSAQIVGYRVGYRVDDDSAHLALVHERVSERLFEWKFEP